MKHELQSAISWLPNDALVEIFLCLGASGTAICAMVCQQWNTLSNDSLALWHHFTREDFCIHLERKEKDENHSNNKTVEWGKIYRYISSRFVAATRDNTMERLPVRVVFADDGLAYMGYPPENAFDPNKGAWCTSDGVDKNVDLVAKLPTTCLVTGFSAQNGNHYYTAPLKEALVFASFQEPPDLEMGKKYNDREGSKWVEKLITSEAMKITKEDSRTVFIHHQHQAKMGKNSPANTDYQPLAAFRFPPNFNDAIRAKFQYDCTSPAVARYIHFKFLNSIHPEGRFSTNIDILNLAIYGIHLPYLSEMLHSLKENIRSDPSYERMHKLRRRSAFEADWGDRF